MLRGLSSAVRGRWAIQLAFNSTNSPALQATQTHTSLPPPPSRTKSLSGTVPLHTSYLLLHAVQPPEKWPSIFASQLYIELQRELKNRGGLVNFCWYSGEAHEVHDFNDQDEAYSATFWRIPRRGELAHRVDIPTISNRSMRDTLHNLFSDGLRQDDEASLLPYFYVCTHAQRDCRCGVRGGEFIESLMRELSERGMLFDQTGRSRVGEVGHVGGHVNAPNVIVFPHGDWYGNLEPSDIPALLDHWFAPFPRARITDAPQCPNRLQWRGRMGMTKEEQKLAVVVRT